MYNEEICSEHSINPRSSLYEGKSDIELQNVDVNFQEHSDGSFAPRSVLVDLDPTSIDAISCSPSGQFYHLDSIVYGSGMSTGQNWAKGYYTRGPDLIDAVMDAIRK